MELRNNNLMADQLENVLAEIGLHGLYNNFRTQRVEIINFSYLTKWPWSDHNRGQSEAAGKSS